MNNELTTIDYLNALKVNKDMTSDLSKEDIEKAKSLLLKRPNLKTVLAVNDVMLYPYLSNMQNTFDLVNELSKRLSISTMVLDKLMTSLDLPEDKINDFWKEATESFEEANKKELDKLNKEKEGKKKND